MIFVVSREEDETEGEREREKERERESVYGLQGSALSEMPYVCVILRV